MAVETREFVAIAIGARVAGVFWGLIFTTAADNRGGLEANVFAVPDGIATLITYAIGSYLCAVGGPA